MSLFRLLFILIKTEDLQADRELLEFALSFKGIYEFKGEEYVKGILFFDLEV